MPGRQGVESQGTARRMNILFAFFNELVSAVFAASVVYLAISALAHLLMPKRKSAGWRANTLLIVLMAFTAVLHVGGMGWIFSLGALIASVLIWAGYRAILKRKMKSDASNRRAPD